jgi:hypothetical protein
MRPIGDIVDEAIGMSAGRGMGEFKARLCELLSGRGWQPIETAPKPGILDPILGGWGKDVDMIFWDDEPSEGEEEGWRSATNHNGCIYASVRPTHWMPLPSPPDHTTG